MSTPASAASATPNKTILSFFKQSPKPAAPPASPQLVSANQSLVPAAKPAAAPVDAVEVISDADSDLQSDEYIVEAIIEERMRKGKKQYLVKWQGYPDSENSWEPLENLDGCPQAIEEYEKRRQVKEKIQAELDLDEILTKQNALEPDDDNGSSSSSVFAPPEEDGAAEDEELGPDADEEVEANESDELLLSDDDQQHVSKKQKTKKNASGLSRLKRLGSNSGAKKKPAQNEVSNGATSAAAITVPDNDAAEMELLMSQPKVRPPPKKRTSVPKGGKPVKGQTRLSFGRAGEDDNADDPGEGRGISLDSDLPVIVKPQEMFDDMIKRIPAFEDFVRTLGRPLRIATMCSGTEAPLLALDMAGKALLNRSTSSDGKPGPSFHVEHVFSCEIEPWKQAYIERNFHPPILFRDIRELGRDKATTAYGAEVSVPGCVDLLVAGTSCVDNSNLNPSKLKRTAFGDQMQASKRAKEILESSKYDELLGESGQTFFGMLAWVRKHKPTIIILENVCGALWELKRQMLVLLGYRAAYMRLDTKNYYIPHTRTRVYLFAVLREVSTDSMVENWMSQVNELARPASASLEAFLLPADDPRLMKVRAQLEADLELKTRARVDWEKCAHRHKQEREQGLIGNKRPVTMWEEGGTCRLPDYAWQEWARLQTDRVLDLTDILFLKLVRTRHFDPLYKTIVWNLSQNADMVDPLPRMGISPCLTPHMVPFITNRGAPALGVEALSLQGIPVQDLLLTRESEKDMADLAGNAMTTTVVGAAMIAALVAAKKAIVSRNSWPTVSSSTVSSDKNGSLSSYATGAANSETVLEADAMVQTSLSLSSSVEGSVSKLLRDAQLSARMCPCEGRETLASSIVRCSLCTHTSCTRCAGRPEHQYGSAETSQSRRSPRAFLLLHRDSIPLRVCLSGLKGAADVHLLTDSGSELAKTWHSALAALEGAELRFNTWTRAEMWIAIYTSKTGTRLELLLDGDKSMWQLIPEPSQGSRGPAKNAFLQRPVARLRVKQNAKNLLEGKWDLFVPEQRQMEVTIIGGGKLVDTFEATLGLPEHVDQKKRWSEWTIAFSSATDDLLNISGTYTLLENCGGPMGSIHRNTKTGLFFMLEQARTAMAEADRFVFAETARRIAYSEQRNELASLAFKWRPSDTKSEKTTCTLMGRWVSASGIKLSVSGQSSASLRTLKPSVLLMASQDGCSAAHTVLHCSLKLVPDEELCRAPASTSWVTLPLLHNSETFAELAWLTQRLRPPSHALEWCSAGSSPHLIRCPRCSPAPPEVQWKPNEKDIMEPYEDPRDAGAFETALKRRPSSFVVQLQRLADSGELRVAMNVASLIHRACGMLPPSRVKSELLFSWRLVEHVQHSEKLPSLWLLSNRHDAEHAQPPNFRKFPLRREQQRSLTWMRQQEASTAVFLEEELEEAVLDPLGWRAEGKVQRAALVRGGIVADQVGYGKTAITIALVDCDRAERLSQKEAIELDEPEGFPQPDAERIRLNATLILAPAHLMKQWPSEVEKFCGSKTFKCVVIQTMADLNKVTVAELMKADIVFVSITVLRGRNYIERLSNLSAATRQLPHQAGRMFDSVYEETLRELRVRLTELTAGPEGVKKTIAAINNSRKDWDDSWGLKTPAVQKDYKQMKCPPLELFYWRRLVIDEFTYLGQQNAPDRSILVNGIQSMYRWCLSGTPPLRGFEDGRAMAELLGLHLGISEELALTSGRSRRQLTRAEMFRFFQEIHTPAWYARRHALAQQFLDRFVRQNVAEIDEIPTEEHVEKFALPPAERAIYLEFDHHLKSMDMKMKRTLRTKKRQSEEDGGDDEECDEEEDGAKKKKSKKRSKKVSADAEEEGELDEDEEPASKKKKGKTGEAAVCNNGKKAPVRVAGLDSDRTERIRELIEESTTAEEALLKRAAHFSFSDQGSVSALDACGQVLQKRQAHLQQCTRDILAGLLDVLRQKRLLKSMDPDYPSSVKTAREDRLNFDWVGDFMRDPLKNDHDPDAHAELTKIIKEAEASPVRLGKSEVMLKKEGEDLNEQLKADKIALREGVGILAKLAKDLCEYRRGLRFMQVVRANADKAASAPTMICPGCKQPIAMRDRGVLLSCGHQGCLPCLHDQSSRNRCILAECRGNVSSNSVLRITDVVPESTTANQDATSSRYGFKLKRIVNLLRDTIPKTERVLICVQFKDLLAKVAEALQQNGLTALSLTGTAKQRSSTIELMQQELKSDGSNRILLLNVTDESASGANLTLCNHIVFVHPLLTASRHEYIACETQAIGRIRRYGQTRRVHIWRFLAEDTIDTHIYEQRKYSWDEAMKNKAKED